MWDPSDARVNKTSESQDKWCGESPRRVCKVQRNNGEIKQDAALWNRISAREGKEIQEEWQKPEQQQHPERLELLKIQSLWRCVVVQKDNPIHDVGNERSLQKNHLKGHENRKAVGTNKTLLEVAAKQMIILFRISLE